MPFYVSRGQIPHKRHTQFRQPDGTLYREEVLGTRGFSGIESILYHIFPPTSVQTVEAIPVTEPAAEPLGPLRHRHFRTAELATLQDSNVIDAQVFLLANDDVRLGVGYAGASMTGFFKNGEEDEVYFIHEGSGTLLSNFGQLDFHSGDYLVVPAGTVYQFLLERPVRFLLLQTPGQIEVPARYRNEYGQFLEHAPFCERDIRVPAFKPPEERRGSFAVRIKARGGTLTDIVLTHHPFDVVGWDGYVYPYCFNIGDFEPITGRVHQPPPVHQTFMGPNFVVCSFVPRLFDYHPQGIPAPYYHSNIDSDEVIYYVRGNFMSRKGISVASITLHPSGIPHGPHPGTAEASIGKNKTEELAVMLDTFRPLRVLKPALAVEDAGYMYSWRLSNGTDT